RGPRRAARVRDRGGRSAAPRPRPAPVPAPVRPAARRVGAKLVTLERQRKSRFCHLDASELDAAGRLPLAGGLPPVAHGGGASTGARVEHMPDERLSPSPIPPLDPRPAAPAPPPPHPLPATPP